MTAPIKFFFIGDDDLRLRRWVEQLVAPRGKRIMRARFLRGGAHPVLRTRSELRILDTTSEVFDAAALARQSKFSSLDALFEGLEGASAVLFYPETCSEPTGSLLRMARAHGLTKVILLEGAKKADQALPLLKASGFAHSEIISIAGSFKDAAHCLCLNVGCPVCRVWLDLKLAIEQCEIKRVSSFWYPGKRIKPWGVVNNTFACPLPRHLSSSCPPLEVLTDTQRIEATFKEFTENRLIFFAPIPEGSRIMTVGSPGLVQRTTQIICQKSTTSPELFRAKVFCGGICLPNAHVDERREAVVRINVGSGFACPTNEAIYLLVDAYEDSTTLVKSVWPVKAGV